MHSHFGGDAFVRLLRPPFSASLSPKDPVFFTIAYICTFTKRPHIFHILLSPNAQNHACHPMTPYFWDFLPYFLQTWITHFLSHIYQTHIFNISLTPNAKNHALTVTQWVMTPYFLRFSLTEWPLLWKCQPYTYIHFILKCPPRTRSLWIASRIRKTLTNVI